MRRIRISANHITFAKALIHLVNLGFIGTWYYYAFTDQLGADPVKTIIHFTGMGALNLLMLTLVVSPFAKWSKQSAIMKLRRLLGLYSFAWAALHLGNYVIFDLQLAFDTLLEDIIKRPYITVGFSAILILMALAITSPRKIQRKLGRNWQKLHNLVYPAGLLIALHFIWSVKSLDPEPLLYWLALLFLLFLRLDKLKAHLKLRRRVT